MSLNTEIPQAFAGSELIRGSLKDTDLADIVKRRNCKIMLVAGKCVTMEDDGTHSLDFSYCPHLLQLIGFSLTTTEAGEPVMVYDSLDPPAACPMYHLGVEKVPHEADEHFIALDIGAVTNAAALNHILHPCEDFFRIMRPLRYVVSKIHYFNPYPEIARAGLAVALSQWHRSHQFCNQCGSPTVSIAGGAKRRCTGPTPHQLYPRTDPVVIMLVESSSGDRILLGRSKKVPAGMLSCLAGFIALGESIEEAVAREVMEEAGVDVDPSSVRIAGSQPWPMGRGASHELMIGCNARARGDAVITIDEDEIGECRWVGVGEARAALETSCSEESPYVKARGGGVGVVEEVAAPPPGFFIPPQFAIAHHLIKAWVESKGAAASGAAASGAKANM